jgi:hypothetical protein
MLLISWTNNPRLAAMALFEAAYLSGNNIQFNFFAGNEFGPPPYGIFLDLPES